MIKASQVLHDTGAEGSDYIDVFAAMTAAQVPCMAQPLESLAGAYVGPSSGGPAIMVNSALGEIPIRHTAGHELAHHAFGHESRLDEQIDLDRGTLGTQLPDQEKLAEAFAAWFLMPRRAVVAAMRRARISRPAGPADVHQISCWLGTSFTGTARHLVNLHLADAHKAEEWTRAWRNGSARLRAALAGVQDKPPDRVWLVRPAANQAVLHVLPGDCLVYPDEYRPETLSAGLEERMPEQIALEPFASVSVTNALTRSAELTLHTPVGPASISVTLVPPPLRLGIDRAWRPRQYPSLPESEKP